MLAMVKTRQIVITPKRYSYNLQPKLQLNGVEIKTLDAVKNH